MHPAGRQQCGAFADDVLEHLNRRDHSWLPDPAVRDYLLRYYSNPIGASANGQRVFTDSQINQITGCASGTVDSAVATAGFVSDAEGNVTGRTYFQGNGTLIKDPMSGTSFVFIPGSSSVVTVAGTVGSNPGLYLGQGYTPVVSPNTVTVITGYVGSTTTPTTVSATMGGQFFGISGGTTSTLTTGGSSPVFGSTTTPFAGGQQGTYGKVLLPSALYGPFVDMYNSAFQGRELVFFPTPQNISFNTTQDVKGDLGDHFWQRARFYRQERTTCATSTARSAAR